MKEYTHGMAPEEEIKWCSNRIKELVNECNVERKNNIRNCSSCGFPSVYCRGLCRACYDRSIKHGDPNYVNIVELREGSSESKENEKPWYVRFRDDIIGSKREYPDDLEAAVMHVLDTLSERDREIVLSRYRDRKTLYVIGCETGISRERVRQIIEIVKKELFNDQELKMFLEIGSEKAYDVMEELKINENRKKENEKRKKEIYLKNLKEKYEKILCQDEQADQEEGLIEILCLDTRAYNGLKMSGIETIQDLVDFIGDPPDFEKLLSLRNIGKGSVKRIKKSIENFFGK